jgi:hypothetical protein
MYKVSILYTSKVQAQFRLAVGSYKDIQNGKAPALQARLPESVSGNTGQHAVTDLCKHSEADTRGCRRQLSVCHPICLGDCASHSANISVC